MNGDRNSKNEIGAGVKRAKIRGGIVRKNSGAFVGARESAKGVENGISEPTIRQETHITRHSGGRDEKGSGNKGLKVKKRLDRPGSIHSGRGWCAHGTIATFRRGGGKRKGKDTQGGEAR